MIRQHLQILSVTFQWRDPRPRSDPSPSPPAAVSPRHRLTTRGSHVCIYVVSSALVLIILHHSDGCCTLSTLRQYLKLNETTSSPHSGYTPTINHRNLFRSQITRAREESSPRTRTKSRGRVRMRVSSAHGKKQRPRNGFIRCSW